MKHKEAEARVVEFRDCIFMELERWAQDFLNLENPTEKIYKFYSDMMLSEATDLIELFEDVEQEIGISSMSFTPIDGATSETMLPDYTFELDIGWYIRGEEECDE